MTKQVLVMKKFPKSRNLRTGKYCAQAAHASLGALLSLNKEISADRKTLTIDISNPFVQDWLLGNFRKITCYVETDQELIDIYNKAQSKNLPAALIKDSGLTEFNGVPTITAVGIGPDSDDLINEITGHLPLF